MKKENMISQLLVSVIIPVFNVDIYLKEALDSVINQTYKNLEIIIIDDGSTDCSGAICDEYMKRDSRIRVIHQENKGLSAARNVGLDIITGDAVAFLDPDDAFEVTFIEKTVTAMINEDVDIVIVRYATHYTISNMSSIANKHDLILPILKAGVYCNIDALNALIAGILTVSVWNKLYSRKLWESIRFPHGHFFEDSEIAYQILDISRFICVIDEVLYHYRKRPGSLTTSMSLQLLNDKIRSCTVVRAFIKTHVPHVFSEAVATKWDRTWLNKLIYYYVVLYRVHVDNQHKHGKKLRMMILKSADEIGLRYLGKRTGIAVCLICLCPWLFRVLYTIYHTAQKHKHSYKQSQCKM